MEYDDLDEFTRAYIEAALWSSNDESDESGGRPMDENYGLSDIHPDTLARMNEDCRKFQEECIEWITWDNLVYFPHRYTTHEKAGHDFWLTRNGHGAGFWDGDWKEDADKAMTAASKRFGNVDLYVGDDGMIHGM